MKIDTANNIIYVRQSWLNDMAICPERARLGLVHPEFRSASDATIIGTSVHAGIEKVLKDGVDHTGMLETVQSTYGELASKPYKKTNIEEEKIPAYLEAMSKAFYDSILPEVKTGGKVEHFFRVPLGITIGQYAIWLEGTMDYIDPDGLIWDWKTASKQYYVKEKQKSAIQPTVYGFAAKETGLTNGDVTTFNYGVMVRGDTPKHQIATVTRTESHYNWLRHFVRGAIGSSVAVGTDTQWFMNDSSNLCSDKWCSFWSVCKGAFVNE
jgi:hypothetical protein